MVSEPVKPYFTRFLRVLTFCLGASKIVILKENGVVNGVVKSPRVSIPGGFTPRFRRLETGGGGRKIKSKEGPSLLFKWIYSPHLCFYSNE